MLGQNNDKEQEDLCIHVSSGEPATKSSSSLFLSDEESMDYPVQNDTDPECSIKRVSDATFLNMKPSVDSTSSSHADDEVNRVRCMLNRLQQEADKQHKETPEDEDPSLSIALTPAEIKLLTSLLDRGYLRLPHETLRHSLPPRTRKLTAIQYSMILSRVRGDGHWPVNVGFRNLEYIIKVPKADAGIPTVGSTLYKVVAPLVNLFYSKTKESIEIPVLCKVSGAFEAGTSTLVLGPPGCGVTSLFKVLSGRAKVGGRYKLKGEQFYSGFRPEDLHLRKLAMYVDQMDQHTAVLTVRETLKFAYECFGGAQTAVRVVAFPGTNQEATEEEKARIIEQLENYPDFIIHNLALDRAADTVVGNPMLRGVSGGEKKRVTSGEMLMARRPLTFYDQISTGLDSAATFDICRRITKVAQTLHLTPVVSLLQPPPEVYDLFDEILILALGYVVYHGPREDVLPYFSSIGFECPFDRDIADFIQEVTTSARVKYQVKNDAPQNEQEMAFAWQISSYSEAKRRAVDRYCNPTNKVDSATRALLYDKSTDVYANPFCKEFQLVLRRQVQLVLRDPAFIKARFMQSIIMGVLIGTVFIRIDPALPTSIDAINVTPITQRYGVMFSTLMQCTFAGMAQVPIVLGQRPVYYKQSSSFFFRTVSYVLGEVVSVMPIAIVESILLGLPMFWITAIVPWGADSQTGDSDVGACFVIFLCIMIILNISFASFLRAVATFVPTPGIGQAITGICASAAMIYSGFVVVRSAMPPWFVWIYYLSPIAWAYRAAVITIFSSKAFTPEQTAFALELFDFEQNEEYIWAGVLMLIGYTFVNIALSYIGYSHFRYDSSARQTKVNLLSEGVRDANLIKRGDRRMEQRLDEDAQSTAEEVLPQYDLTSRHKLRMESSLQNDNFIPVDLVFRNLWYSVQGPDDKKGKYSLDLLKDVSGFAEAGTLTALMGSSGAGKTTLLDVLALRKTSGLTQGQVLVNGHPQEKITFSRIVGYVEQNDIHSPFATVEEALIFSATLRQSANLPREAKESFVEGVIATLDLSDIRDFKIGSKFSGGLTTEQVKRVTIGVELAANPAIVFADEPTSGLDANSARAVMIGLERIARAGRTVICTIHQPSKDIFLKFDRLLLLQRGGEIVYFGDLGERACHLLNYLAGIPGTPQIPNARYNPATFMLEVIGAGANSQRNTERIVDFALEYRESQLFQDAEAKISSIIDSNLDNRAAIAFDQSFASNFSTQLEQLTKRWLRAYWRNPGYNTTRITMTVFIATFFGLTFLQQAKELNRTQDVQSFCGLLYIATAFTGVIAVNTAIPTIMEERAPFYRERAASYYGVAPMICAITSAEVPYVIAGTVSW